jgi:hypothetical protein
LNLVSYMTRYFQFFEPTAGSERWKRLHLLWGLHVLWSICRRMNAFWKALISMIGWSSDQDGTTTVRRRILILQTIGRKDSYRSVHPRFNDISGRPKRFIVLLTQQSSYWDRVASSRKLPHRDSHLIYPLGSHINLLDRPATEGIWLVSWLFWSKLWIPTQKPFFCHSLLEPLRIHRGSIRLFSVDFENKSSTYFSVGMTETTILWVKCRK